MTGELVGGNLFADLPDAVAPDAVAPDAVAPDAVAPDAVAPDAVAPDAVAEERVDDLLRGGSFRLVRIVGTGQATPPGQWYDQDEDEWVVVLKGSAGLLVEGEDHARELAPGDYLVLPAHCRHRVEWSESPTVWLALHALSDL